MQRLGRASLRNRWFWTSVTIMVLLGSALASSTPLATTSASAISDNAVTFRAVSRGACGYAEFYRNEIQFYRGVGCSFSGRGFNVAAIDPSTGNVIQPVQHFDTWFDAWRANDDGTVMRAMIAFLNGLPDGTLVLIAVADEAGLGGINCQFFTDAWVETALKTFEALGSRQIRSYCYWDSWAMAAIKGSGQAIQEAHSSTDRQGSLPSTEVSVTAALIPLTPLPTVTPTLTATPTSTPTPTATSTPTALPQACKPRPDVRVVATRTGDGTLQVSILSQHNAGLPTNALAGLTVTGIDNATVRMNGSTVRVGVPVQIPAGVQQLQFEVQRLTAGQPTTVRFVARDACGDWPSFVGGGPGAF